MSEIETAILLAGQKQKKIIEIRDARFPQQDKFILDPARYLAALCTRRAGKTNALALRFIRTMYQYPGSYCRYIALTRDSAKDIMWPVLEEINERYELNAKFTESNLTMKLPCGSKLRLFGADMKNFIRRLKGAKSPGVAIDEAQEFGPHIEQLIDDVLTPTLADYPNSWIALAGTPGPLTQGIFYNITEKNAGNYSVHKWSLYDNPYMPDPHSFVKDLKEKKEWADDNPTYLREYCGKWAQDVNALLIKYDQIKNHYDTLPRGPFIYILGVDLGIRDADALAVLAWNENSPNIYLVEEKLTKGQDITALTEQIKKMMGKYEISKIIMDEGALGKKIAEEIRRRHQIPVLPADKMRKMENVAFLNDFMRLGRFKAKSQSKFAQDSRLVQIDYEKSTPDKLVVKKGYHSDIIDAVLYAFKESPAYTYQEPVKKPKWGSPGWHDQEASEMEKAAEEHFKELQNSDDDGFGWGSAA